MKLPEFTRHEELALQVEVLVDGDAPAAKALARHFERNLGNDWFRPGGFERLKPRIHQEASSLATRWLGFRGADGQVREEDRHPDTTASAGSTSLGANDTVLEEGLLLHLMHHVGAQRGFLSLLSPRTNQFSVTVSIPKSPLETLGRGASADKSLVGLVVNWKCPYLAADITECLAEPSTLDGWWKPSSAWGRGSPGSAGADESVHSVLCVPLLVPNRWPKESNEEQADGLFPYPIGAIYLEHDQIERFTRDHLALAMLLAKSAAPWLLSRRRGIGLREFQATTEFDSRSESPGWWPRTLSRGLGSALSEERADCGFALHSVAQDKDQGSKEDDSIDAIVNVPQLAEENEQVRERVQRIFQPDDNTKQDEEDLDKVIPAECRRLAKKLDLHARPGTTRAARQRALSPESEKSGELRKPEGEATWACNEPEQNHVAFFRGVVSTVSVAVLLKKAPESLLVSVTAECSAATLADEGRNRSGPWSIRELREVGAQGWLREPYFFAFEEAQHLKAITRKLADFVWTRQSAARPVFNFAGFVVPTRALAQKLCHQVDQAQLAAQSEQRSILLVRGPEGAGKTALVKAIGMYMGMPTGSRNAETFDRFTWSPFLLEQRFPPGPRPGLLVLDDADRADPSVVEALARLLGCGRRPNAVLVVTFTGGGARMGQRDPGAELITALSTQAATKECLGVIRAELKRSACGIIDIEEFRTTNEIGRRNVWKGCFEIENGLQANDAAAGGRTVVTFDGPDDEVLGDVAQSKELQEIGEIRKFLRTWMFLARMSKPDQKRIKLEGKDVVGARRLHGGGAVISDEDLDDDIVRLELKYIPDLKPVACCVFRTLISLHKTDLALRRFDRQEVIDNAVNQRIIRDEGERHKCTKTDVIGYLREVDAVSKEGDFHAFVSPERQDDEPNVTHKHYGLKDEILRELFLREVELTPPPPAPTKSNQGKKTRRTSSSES